MDGRLDPVVKEELQHQNKKLEATIEIIMEHLRDTETRLEEMEKRIEELTNGSS